MMAITKDAVRTFLTKVKAKALNSVEKRHKELFEAAINKYLEFNNATLRRGLEMLEETSEKIDAGCVVSEGKAFKPLTDSVKSLRRNIFYGNEYGSDLKRYYRLKDDEEVQEAWEAWMTEKKAVETEYRRVFSLIDAASNGPKAMAVLKKLGFDVSSLEKWEPPVATVDTINKDALFVCGEKA